jgi:rhodanese-related sulfurtransferase
MGVRQQESSAISVRAQAHIGLRYHCLAAAGLRTTERIAMGFRASSTRLLIGMLLCASCAGGSCSAGADPHAVDAEAAPAPDLAGAGGAGSAAAWPTGKYITIDEVYARVQAHDTDMLLVNVVDEEYYNLGFITGSLKIPWDTLAGRLVELDRERHIVLYCRKGVRSESAYTTLVDNAFPLVWVMEGGIEKWLAAGYPVVTE